MMHKKTPRSPVHAPTVPSDVSRSPDFSNRGPKTYHYHDFLPIEPVLPRSLPGLAASPADRNPPLAPDGSGSLDGTTSLGRHATVGRWQQPRVPIA
jgi:hypothetical protein